MVHSEGMKVVHCTVQTKQQQYYRTDTAETVYINAHVSALYCTVR
jgi:hypothetical protein